MNLNYFYPFLGYGLVLLGANGNPLLLLISLLTILAWWANQERRKVDLHADVQFQAGRVWIGEHRLGLFPPLWGTDIRNLVYEAAFRVDPLEGKDPEILFQEQIGITKVGAPVYQPLSPNQPHVLILGPTGSGKTELAKLIASQYGAEIWVVDFSDGQGLAGFPMVRALIKPTNLGELPKLQKLIVERSEQKANRNLLLIVENLGQALCDPELEKLISRVATGGRSFNTMLLATNQTLSSVPRTLWVNCFTRVSLGADPVDRAILGFEGVSPRGFSGLFSAEMLEGSKRTSFGFPIGSNHEKTAPESSEAVNPFLARASTRPL